MFGDDILEKSSPSGRAGTEVLDPDKLSEIHAIVRGRANELHPLAFEALWSKCLMSISKTCQGIRYRKIKKYSVKL